MCADIFDELKLDSELIKDIRKDRLDRIYSPAELLEYYRVLEPKKYPRFKELDNFFHAIEAFYWQYGIPDYALLDSSFKAYAKEQGCFMFFYTFKYVRDMWDRVMAENKRRCLPQINALGVWEITRDEVHDLMLKIEHCFVRLECNDARGYYHECVFDVMLRNRRLMFTRNWYERKAEVLAVVEAHGDELVMAHNKGHLEFSKAVSPVYDHFQHEVYVDDIGNACRWYVDAQANVAPSTKQMTLF